MIPKLSYTVWFSQRTGSSLLCKTLELTDIAGKPNEWLVHKPNLLVDYNQPNHDELQKHIWEIGSTSNGVFGLKHSYCEPQISQLIETFRKFPNCPQNEHNRTAIWEHAFPNHRHILMTRRNKVRLAVSWWKAIQTQEWYRLQGNKPQPKELSEAYSFDAINHLYAEASMREAGLQEFFAEGNIVPLTIVYEDFIQEYERSIRLILDYLGLEVASAKIDKPYFTKLADEISEEWAQRFRAERQNGWPNVGW